MKLEAPRLPAAPESAGLMESVRHAREQVEDVVGRLFQGELLEHSQLGEVEFRGCIFENCRLTGAVFQRVAFTDVLFKDCDLSGAVWQRCGTQRCALRDCKAAGVISPAPSCAISWRKTAGCPMPTFPARYAVPPRSSAATWKTVCFWKAR